MSSFVMRKRVEVEKRTFDLDRIREESLCVTKKTIPYFFYTEGLLKELEEFCAPYEVIPIKKRKQKNKVTLNLPTGCQSITYGQVIIKMTDKKFLILDKTSFFDLFECPSCHKKYVQQYGEYVEMISKD